MSNKAHLTAITRNALSTPAAHLHASNLLLGRVLDYGCGRGFDADTLGATGYDPYHRPVAPSGTFDTIMCNFVLNVIEDEAERRRVVASIQSLLAPNGVAYISVRNDRKALRGTTSKGTWQGYIELPYPVVKKTAGFVMYQVGAICEQRA